MTFTKACGYLLDLGAFCTVAMLASSAGFGIVAQVCFAIGVDLAFQASRKLINS